MAPPSVDARVPGFLYQKPSRSLVVGSVQHPVGWAKSQSSVHVIPRTHLLHHFTPAQNGLPYRYIIRSDGCGLRGVAGFEVDNGRQGAHFRDSRCHGMLQKKGKLLEDA
jgi:hypothetical protein